MRKTREEKLRDYPNVLANKRRKERERYAKWMLADGHFGSVDRIARICKVDPFWLSLQESKLRR